MPSFDEDEIRADQLRDGIAWLRSSKSKHLQAAGTCWAAALGALASLKRASEEERAALAKDAAQLVVEGSDAWSAFIEHELTEMTRLESSSGMELGRLLRIVTAFRRSLRGDRAAGERLGSQLETLAKRLDAIMKMHGGAG